VKHISFTIPSPALRQPSLVTRLRRLLQQTGDLNLLRDRRVRAAVVGYAGALEVDRAGFDRWMERKSVTEERFGAQAQRAVRGRRPRESIMREWVTALRDDPELRVIVESMIFTRNNRRGHLHRMLEETQRLRGTLEGAVIRPTRNDSSPRVTRPGQSDLRTALSLVTARRARSHPRIHPCETGDPLCPTDHDMS
jgi:hypothetical protein